MPRSKSNSTPPAGLFYQPELVSPAEENELVARLDALEYGRIVLHGVPSKREVASFGWRYSFQSNELSPAPAVPDWLASLRQRAAAVVGSDAQALVQALVNRYPPGAGIGYHRDLPVFGAPVIGVSLLAPCPMRFQRGKGADREVYVLELEARSLYALQGAARSQWEHGITACPSLRYSITFRALARSSRRDT